jgi:hypothetical protein
VSRELQENRARDIEFNDEKGNTDVNSVRSRYGRLRRQTKVKCAVQVLSLSPINITAQVNSNAHKVIAGFFLSPEPEVTKRYSCHHNSSRFTFPIRD